MKIFFADKDDFDITTCVIVAENLERALELLIKGGFYHIYKKDLREVDTSTEGVLLYHHEYVQYPE